MNINELLDCCPDEVPMIVEAEYKGKTVSLNSPFRTPGGPRKFSVYVKNAQGNVIKVNFGDPNSTIKNDDPKAAASFQARHRCSQQKDKTSAAWWSCNIARYAKSLGLSSSRPW